jgi:hypothetical protein
MRRRLCAATLAISLVGCSDPATGPITTDASPSPAVTQGSTRTPEVHVVYLVPADVDVRGDYVQNLRAAITNLQAWYGSALGTGETFTLAHPTVLVYQTEHEARWYATNPLPGVDQSLWFWFNATTEGFAATGGSFSDPDDVWIFYIDAAPACGQLTGGAASVALLPVNDLRGLAGEPTIGTCTGEVEPDLGPCRWVGGLGHELGHALGLPHPAGCESGSPDCPIFALMWVGYLTYPDAYLTTSDRAILDESVFISAVKMTGKVPSCSSIGASALSMSGATTFTTAPRAAVGRAASPAACAYRTLLGASQTTLGDAAGTSR